MVETPVLFITFARPEYASQSFAAIKKAQPKKLYFYSNKARIEKPDEIKRNEEVRSYVNLIDWDCEVKTWFREEYVDVFTSIKGAIDWIFNNEERACVIEEDVVGSSAFFDYIDKMLKLYEDNPKVAMISGNNATPQFNPNGLDCFPTRFADIYGWASWRKVWIAQDWDMVKWPEFRKSKEFRNYYGSWLQAVVQKKWFNLVYNGKPSYNPWDYIFTYNMAMNKTYCMMSKANLTSDVGIVGENHKSNMISPLSTVTYKSDKYPITQMPIEIKPTSFDDKSFLEYRFKSLVRRQIKKYLHI